MLFEVVSPNPEGSSELDGARHDGWPQSKVFFGARRSVTDFRPESGVFFGAQWAPAGADGASSLSSCLKELAGGSRESGCEQKVWLIKL